MKEACIPYVDVVQGASPSNGSNVFVIAFIFPSDILCHKTTNLFLINYHDVSQFSFTQNSVYDVSIFTTFKKVCYQFVNITLHLQYSYSIMQI